MPVVPLPDRGQPLDVTFIYGLANEINKIADNISTATYNYTTIDIRGIGKRDVKNNNAKFFAGYIDVINNETVTANTSRQFTLNFDSDFKYPPVVIAAAVNTGTSDVGNDVFAVINSVSTSSVTGVVRFNSSGSKVGVAVNIIAIGIPG
jgi:hypothetical protein